MTDDLSNSHLDLLVPWDLPIDLNLSSYEKVVITHALTQLLTALNSKEQVAEAIALIDQTIINLGEGHQSMPNIPKTKIVLKQWEIADYDRYFNIQHIESDTPAICIVCSLLLTYRQFLYLCEQNPSLNPIHIAQQKQGFEAIAHLLIRSFNLSVLNFSL